MREDGRMTELYKAQASSPCYDVPERVTYYRYGDGNTTQSYGGGLYIN